MKTVSVNCTNCGISFEKPTSYVKQGQKRGYTNHFCSNKCSCEHNKKLNKCLPSKRKDEYYKTPKKCLNCESVIPYEDKAWKKYCSQKCAAIHVQKDGGHKWSEEDKKRISNWAKKHAFVPNPKNRIKLNCLLCNKEFETILSNSNKKCCSRKCSNEWIVNSGYLKNKGRGGYRPNSGTSKKGWYKGYYCGSSWELAWVIFNLEHGIAFKRNEQGFDYVFEDKARKYYPDFVVGDEYIEIKGYHSKQFDAKVVQFPFKLNVLHKKELKPILDYVISKYGKNFVEKYD